MRQGWCIGRAVLCAHTDSEGSHGAGQAAPERPCPGRERSAVREGSVGHTQLNPRRPFPRFMEEVWPVSGSRMVLWIRSKTLSQFTLTSRNRPLSSQPLWLPSLLSLQKRKFLSKETHLLSESFQCSRGSAKMGLNSSPTTRCLRKGKKC